MKLREKIESELHVKRVMVRALEDLIITEDNDENKMIYIRSKSNYLEQIELLEKLKETDDYEEGVTNG